MVGFILDGRWMKKNIQVKFFIHPSKQKGYPLEKQTIVLPFIKGGEVVMTPFTSFIKEGEVVITPSPPLYHNFTPFIKGVKEVITTSPPFIKGVI